MSAAYHRFFNGAHVAVSITGKTNDIKRNTPHGNPAGEGGVTRKTPGSVSVVTGK